MMIFLESPIPWIFLGIVGEAILGAILLTTRRGVVFLAMLGMLLLVVGGLVLERVVVTQREEVEDALDGAAAAIQANDLPGARRYLARSATATLQRLSGYMGLVEFEEIRLRNVEIEVNELTSPPSAEVRLWGVARFHDRGGQFPHGAWAGWLEFEMVREPDGWKVEDVAGDPHGRPYDGPE